MNPPKIQPKAPRKGPETHPWMRVRQGVVGVVLLVGCGEGGSFPHQEDSVTGLRGALSSPMSESSWQPQVAEQLPSFQRQDLSIRFDGESTHVRRRGGPEVSLKLQGWGRGSAALPPSLRNVQREDSPGEGGTQGASTGFRWVRRGEGLEERWTQSSLGVSQSFLLTTSPPGEGGPLWVAVEVSGAQVAVDENGLSAQLNSGKFPIHYRGLRVLDSNHIPIPAHLESAPWGLRIVVEDQGAAYPLLIDPYLTGPQVMVESDRSYSRFGQAVAGAGDVDGDGYSDFIVGARNYTNGQTNEGAVYLYQGSIAGVDVSPTWQVEGEISLGYQGFAVAGAGDVNGDGFSDILVGSPTYANGQTAEGRVQAFYGSPFGLDYEPDWVVESNTLSARFGYALAGVGDVNGDGYSDVVVGAPYLGNGMGQTNEGRIYLFLGSASGLSTTPSGMAESNRNGAYFGQAIAGLGDVDGDGLADFAVGAPYYSNGQTQEGGVYLFSGGAALADPAAATLESNQAGAFFGISVGGAGDVNGDGSPDLVVGGSNYDGGETDEGGAWLYLGTSLPGGVETSPHWQWESNQAGGRGGVAVAGAGDVNGDGYADVAVGGGSLSYDYDSLSPSQDGVALLFHGGAGGLGTSASWGDSSGITVSYFGESLAGGGDFNGDGYGDLLVGEYAYSGNVSEEGRVSVYLGEPGSLHVIPSQAVAGTREGQRLGEGVAFLGDVNGDGFGDALLTSPEDSLGDGAEGSFAVHLGSAAGLEGTAVWSGDGGQGGARAGRGADSAGDVNGDGYADVLVVAPLYDGLAGADEGRVWLHLGSPGDGVEAVPSWSFSCGDAGGGDPRMAAIGAGDLNQDGYGDLLVGCGGALVAESPCGVVHGFWGGADGMPVEAFTLSGFQEGEGFGSTLAAGDVDGDGRSDLVIGAPAYDGANSGEGRVEGWRTGMDGIPEATFFAVQGGETGAALGAGMGAASLCDVNGDGLADLLLSSPGAGDGGTARLHLGSPSGLELGAAWSVENGQAGAMMGARAVAAGDVNSDGYCDLALGAPRETVSADEEGRSYLYLGSPSGPSPSWDWSQGGRGENALAGSALAGGDLDGDGFSDLLVGVPGHEVDLGEEGEVLLYQGDSGQGENSLIPIQLQALRPGDGHPIPPSGHSGDPGSFFLQATLITPYGPGNVKLVAEIKPLGTPFDGTSLRETDYQAVDGDGESTSLLIDGLSDATGYHYRARLSYDPVDGFSEPHSHWVYGGTPGNAQGVHLRTGCGDEDGDGASLCGGDCDDTDPAVGPNEIEVCDNGVDDDCNGFQDEECPASCSISPVSPSDGADLTASAQFRWTGDCEGYRVEVSPDDSFPADATYYFGALGDAAGPNVYGVAATIWSSVGRSATEGAFWRIVGGKEGRSVASDTRSFFTTLTPLPPPADPVPGCTVSLTSPADGTEVTAAPTFRWSTSCTGAYVEISADSNFPVEDTFVFGALGSGRYTVPDTIWDALDQRFVGGGYWRVTAGAAEGPVSTPERTFSVP